MVPERAASGDVCFEIENALFDTAPDLGLGLILIPSSLGAVRCKEKGTIITKFLSKHSLSRYDHFPPYAFHYLHLISEKPIF